MPRMQLEARGGRRGGHGEGREPQCAWVTGTCPRTAMLASSLGKN